MSVKTVLLRKVRQWTRWSLANRRVSSIIQNKAAKNKKKQEKELRQLDLLEEAPSQKRITTDLSDAEYNIIIPPGSKKDVDCPLPPTYSSRFVEACWYDWWEREGFFKPVKKVDSDDVFSMVIPPPNVTGKLHLGHALTVALEDVLCRWNRMRGREVVWVPGCDHAGIATQAVVEKLLAAKNISRHELGREKFLEEVWKWKDKKEEEIYDQLRVLGASLDWTRTNFTLSPEFSYAVQEAFIRLHEQKLIERRESLINWSSALRSTISDIETDNLSLSVPTKISVPGHKKPVEFGVMHTFSYPLLNPTTEVDSVSVSTTRIETMLGDTGIAVNPEDPRYSSLVGCEVQHPILQDVTLPIVADGHVVKDFGTGAVKITPGHDFYDFEIGQRHNLPTRDILDDAGRISCPENDDLHKLPRFIARERIIEILESQGLYRGKQSHEMILPICSRSGDVVEPRMKTQWFVRTKELAKQALNAVKTGQIQLEPDSHIADWNYWLNNNVDWCISRQLWWGHRVPAYKVTGGNGDSTWVSAHNEEEAARKAEKLLQDSRESFSISQDEDVLDTWFSSALFPFASFGWPENTEDLRRYYPLSVMETGYDLLFFWVARMTMMGIALTEEVPFKVVYLHTMVRDSQGRKMSKSLGNVIDPIEVIKGCSGEELDAKIKSSHLSPKEEKFALKNRAKTLPHGIPECGTDALRFYLCLNKKSGRDLSLDVHSVVQYRYFCNKIWNVFKFLQANVGVRDGNETEYHQDDRRHLRPVDSWIRSRLSAVVEISNTALETLNFAAAATNIHKFFFVDFADFYLESCKPVFNDRSKENMLKRQAVERNFDSVFETFLRLLSPFMPYITEELWQRLPNRDTSYTSVTLADYPNVDNHNFRDLTLEDGMDTVRCTIQALRSVKLLFKVPKTLNPEVVLLCKKEKDIDYISQNEAIIKDLAKIGKLEIASEQNISGIPESVSYSVPDNTIKIFMKLKGLVDAESQSDALQKKAESHHKRIGEIGLKIAESKREEVREKLMAKMEQHKQKLGEIENIILNLEQLR